jgi:hypothetical protein
MRTFQPHRELLTRGDLLGRIICIACPAYRSVSVDVGDIKAGDRLFTRHPVGKLPVSPIGVFQNGIESHFD